jgi:predicted DNA-binding WGR domain protein
MYSTISGAGSNSPKGVHWGRIGTSGQELVEIFDDELEAGEALEAVARAKRRRGYRDL